MHCEPIVYTEVLPILPRFIKMGGIDIWHNSFARFAIDIICETPLVIYGVKSIKRKLMFQRNALSNIVILDGVTTIESEAFAECKNLKHVKLPNTLTYIASKAFNKCNSLESIVIPASVNHIGADAFMNCENLQTVIFESKTPPKITFNIFNINYLETIYVPDEDAKTAYINSYKWGNYVNFIRPISKLHVK